PCSFSPPWLDGFWSVSTHVETPSPLLGALEASEVPRGRKRGAEEGRAKGYRFAAGMDGATSRLCVRACPAIGTKLTGGTIPSPAQRRAHVGRWPEGGASGRGRRSTGRRRGATRYGGPGFGALTLEPNRSRVG